MVAQNLEFLDDSPSDLWKLKNAVLSKINLVEVMTEYGIMLEPKQTGRFTHRTACPFHRGKGGGRERTPSFYIDSGGSFFCFGCSMSGNAINFVSQIEGMPLTAALQKLAMKAGLIDENGRIDSLLADELPCMDTEPIKTIDPLLVEIGAVLRSYVKRFIGSESFEREFEWAEKVGAKVDEFLLDVGFEDWEYVKDICDKVKSTVKSRIRKKEKR